MISTEKHGFIDILNLVTVLRHYTITKLRKFLAKDRDKEVGIQVTLRSLLTRATQGGRKISYQFSQLAAK